MSGSSNSIKSKQRVVDHGEVFTNDREVSAMLNLVKHETERIDSRFLEPACGTGNFLAPLLEKKLAVVKSKYSKSQLEFERYSIIAIGSVYGVDILEDNVCHCRDRLFDVFNAVYTSLYKKKSKDPCRDAVRYMLSRNILWGDALSLKTVTNESEPIVFSEWSLVRGSLIKRRDYIFAELIPNRDESASLFSTMSVSDTGAPVFIPKPIKEYDLSHYLNLHENAR
jgi:hypothetical protein